MTGRPNQLLGHLCALFAALNWGFTFILTDIAMNAGLTAFEALLLRSLTAYVFLWIICPRPPRLSLKGGIAKLARSEWPFVVAGLSGLSVYFLLDYSALNYTSASFVTILCGTVPLFMAVGIWLVYKEPPKKLFLLGFVIAVSGVVLVSTAGGQGLQVSTAGTLLVSASNVLWAIYAIMLRRIDEADATGEAAADATGVKAGDAASKATGEAASITSALLNLRHIFFWGAFSLILMLPFFGFDVSDVNMLSVSVLAPILILGVMTSALTFLAYSLSIRWLGVSKASVYQYFPPAVGAVAAHFILGETITMIGMVGIAVIVIGLLLSERVSGSDKPAAPNRGSTDA